MPYGLKVAKNLGYKTIFNFGCGYGYKYHSELLKDIELINYDKYIDGINDLNSIDISKIEIVVCNNVLNVIDNEKELNEVIETLLSYNKDILITVYEGNRSGIGKYTQNKTYQANKKSKDYKILFEKGFIYKNKVFIKKASL